jgi:hypothetical protein
MNKWWEKLYLPNITIIPNTTNIFLVNSMLLAVVLHLIHHSHSHQPILVKASGDIHTWNKEISFRLTLIHRRQISWNYMRSHIPRSVSTVSAAFTISLITDTLDSVARSYRTSIHRVKLTHHRIESALLLYRRMRDDRYPFSRVVVLWQYLQAFAPVYFT